MNEFYEHLIRKLAAAGIDSPRLEARLICAAALKCLPSEIDFSLNEAQKQEALAMLEQRLKHKPLDKILGHKEFYKSDFAVDENVLSPRPDTEVLVEAAISLVRENQDFSILDLGTGSGCIIISILAECLNARGLAVDISEKSLAIARSNAEKNGVASRLELQQGDWFKGDFVKNIGKKFDLIVSNPPYIPTDEIAALEPEVKDYDPLKALDGGQDGLDSYKRIAEVSGDLLKDGGYILLEAGAGQSSDIVRIFCDKQFQLIDVIHDLAQIARCVILQKPVAEI